MKTAIFLNTFAKMNNYDLPGLMNKDIKMVAIVTSTEYHKYKEKYSMYFDEIYSFTQSEDKELNNTDYDFAFEIITKEISNGREVRLICLSEDNLLFSAKLRDAFDLSGMGFEETLPFRDKVAMKDKIREAKLRVPAYAKLKYNKIQDIKNEFITLSETLGLPFLLKPISALGGSGIQKIHNINDFQKHYYLSEHTDYEAEEFINGTLYHCDSIIKNGETLFVVCCEYSNPNFDFQAGKSIISLPLRADDEIAQRIIKFSTRALKALKLHNGVSHVEVFVNDKNEIIFLEAAARSPGGLVTPMYRRAFNVPFEDIAYQIEMGIDFELKIHSDKYYMSGILPALCGTIKTLHEPKILSDCELIWAVKEGDVRGPCSSVRDQAGSLIIGNHNYEELLSDFIYLKDFISMEVI